MNDVVTSQVDRIEIRVLGPLRVRRADGVLVDSTEWRTGKTADLLRLLALHVDTPVPVDVLLEALWPSVDARRGRASLRTAASRIRKVLGGDCLERRLGGLALRGAWVDARALTMLAQEARRHMLSGDWARVVGAARDAEPLYLHQVRWSVGDAEWAVRERDALEAAFRQLLADAADAAVSLSWWYDALDLAEHAILLEPLSERSYRAIMRSHRGLGESSRALQAYDQCRRVLAEELGADPSAETQALHQELLKETQPAVPVPAFSGRTEELRWLHEVARAGSPAPLVCLLGGAGSGKSRLLREAWPQGSPALRLSATDDDAAWASLADLLGGDTPPAVLLVDDAHTLTPARVDALAVVDGVPVVAAGRPDPGHGPIEQLRDRVADRDDGRVHQLHLPPLAQDETAALCEAVLHGTAAEDLVQAVLDETQTPGGVIDLLRGWATRGRVAATRDGLVLVQADRPDAMRLPRTILLTEAVDHLAAKELELLHLVAVMGRPVSPEGLLPMLATAAGETDEARRTWVGQTLDDLVDRALLVPTGQGFTTCEPLMRDALLAWLRPSALRRLHRTIAERAHIPASARIAHWQGAGEPELAKAAAFEASAEALSEGQYEQALPHLRQLSALTATADAVPSDRLEVSERLGDVYGALGRPHEAQVAYAEAAQVAQAAHLPELERLDSKLRSAEEASLVIDLRAPSSWDAGFELSVDLDAGAPSGRDVEQRLTAQLHAADATEDCSRQAEVRMLLAAHVCVPRRQFRAVHRWTTEAVDRAPSSSQQARALLVGWLPGAVLGNALAAEPQLSQAASLLAAAQDSPPTVAHVAALRSLVAHDLGRPDLDERLVEATEAGSFDDDSDHRWVLVRIATERGDLASAEAWNGTPVAGSAPPVVRQLRALATAALAAELEQTDRARKHLLEVIDLGDGFGATLLVPEAAARLVMLEASSDPASARERFELFEWAVGADRLLPRESVLRHLARGAMRAADRRYDDAAVAAAAAADAAERAGLVLLAAEAHRHRAIHLAEAGRRSESRLASAAASRSYEAAGAGACVDRAAADSRRVWSVGSAVLSRMEMQHRPEIRLLRGVTPPR